MLLPEKNYLIQKLQNTIQVVYFDAIAPSEEIWKNSKFDMSLPEKYI